MIKKMKNNFIYCGALVLSSFLTAQTGKVGIGTNAPQQTLHIDPAKNTVGTPSTNTNDDVVVTSQGYMGIGTVNPSARLEIKSNTPNAIKITDGTEKQNAFLRSDANGVGSWYLQGSIKPIELGVWTPSDPIIRSGPAGASTVNLNVSITLTPGIWMVNFGATFKMSNVSTPYWLHLYLSESTTSRVNTNFDYLGGGGNNTGYAGLMIPNKTAAVGNANLISGSSIIRVKPNQTVKLWVLAENFNTSTNPSSSVVNWNFKADNWENYLYAIPLDGI